MQGGLSCCKINIIGRWITVHWIKCYQNILSCPVNSDWSNYINKCQYPLNNYGDVNILVQGMKIPPNVGFGIVYKGDYYLFMVIFY